MVAIIVAGALVVFVGAWVVVGYVPVRHIETPQYEVVSVRNAYELRRYPAHIVAEVKVSGTYKEAVNRGFRKVADYIFGNNTASDSIAMTAPVLHEKQSAAQKIAMTAPVLHGKTDETDIYTVAFVMPRAYTLEMLPAPNNPDVAIRAVPSKTYAAVRFRGYATENAAARRTAQLLALLKQDNITPMGSPVVAEYHPPWTPPFMRRNEVLIELP